MQTDTDTGSHFSEVVRRSTRATGIIGGAVAVLGFPAWVGFDLLVDPTDGAEFALIRLICTIPMAALWLALIYTRLGHRHPEWLLLSILLIVDAGIALMITRLDDNYAAYALGMSIPIYASAFLLIWPPRYSAILVGITLGTLTAVLLAGDPIATDALATIYFYLVTAGVVSIVGQHFRQAAARREFEIIAALKHEQERSSELVEELDRQSREDALTGLANRRAWDEALELACARSEREGSEFVVLMADLDQLKQINDRLGHAVGDAVLRTVARLLSERARAGDVVARIGGDEFAVLSTGTDLLGGTELAEQLRTKVEGGSSAAAGIGGVTVSIGVADWEGGDDSPTTLMLRADRRLYTAKATRNVVCAGDPGH